METHFVEIRKHKIRDLVHMILIFRYLYDIYFLPFFTFLHKTLQIQPLSQFPWPLKYSLNNPFLNPYCSLLLVYLD